VLGDGVACKLAHLRQIAHVAGLRARLAARLADLSGDCLHLTGGADMLSRRRRIGGRADIGDHHCGAFAGELFRDGFAEAPLAARACDDGGLAGKSRHSRLP